MRFRPILLTVLPLLGFAPLAMAQTTPPRAHAAATRAGQFTAEAAAKEHCPADTVVWVNKTSKAIHAAGTAHYGKTKTGAYMCRKDAETAGFHATRARTTAAGKPAAPPTRTEVR